MQNESIQQEDLTQCGNPGEVFHLISEESGEGWGSVPGGGSSMGSRREGRILLG